MDNPENYLNHSLNTSVSKNAYSFPKSERSSLAKKILNHSCYELPNTRTSRATSFGYGNKMQLANVNSCSPPPNTYHHKSEFEQVDSNSIAFAKGRDQIKFGYFLEAANRLKRFPAPNAYKIKLKTLGSRGGRIGSKLPTEIDQMMKKKVPGPGEYQLEGSDMKNSGSFFLAKYVNSRSPRMHDQSHSSMSRSKKIKTELGPSSYETRDGEFGRSVLSRFRNSMSGSFGKSERPGLVQKSKLSIPGHKYKRFSDFGNLS